MTGNAEQLGMYGFGAAGHIVAQVARWRAGPYTRSRVPMTLRRRTLPAVRARCGPEHPTSCPKPGSMPQSSMPPAGQLVPAALRALRRGGRVICAGIHMSDIPSFPYNLLWQERQLVSVANLTRQDGLVSFKIAPQAGIRSQTTGFRLVEANEVLEKLWTGQILGAPVLQP